MKHYIIWYMIPIMSTLISVGTIIIFTLYSKNKASIKNQLKMYQSQIEYLQKEIVQYENQCRRLEKNEQKLWKQVNSPFINKRALIGDYMFESSENLRLILRKLGFEVDVVSEVNQIIDRLSYQKNQSEKYDIIFTNNTYPDHPKNSFNGTEGEYLLYMVKEQLKSTIPIIVVSHLKSPETFLESGFDGYIEKYVSYHKVVTCLNNIFKKS